MRNEVVALCSCARINAFLSRLQIACWTRGNNVLRNKINLLSTAFRGTAQIAFGCALPHMYNYIHFILLLKQFIVYFVVYIIYLYISVYSKNQCSYMHYSAFVMISGKVLYNVRIMFTILQNQYYKLSYRFKLAERWTYTLKCMHPLSICISLNIIAL